MSYRCMIVDDESLARELIESHLGQLDNFTLVASCTSAIEASKILKNESIDLMFLDIEMPVLKGTDFFKNLIHKPKVIFTTAYRDYAVDGFDLNAVDYLLKPITFSRFFRAIEKFVNQNPNTSQTTLSKDADYIFVTKNRKKVKIDFNQILYIESLKDYVKVHMPDVTHTVKYSISNFEKELDNRFVRVHRSYIVNHNKITAFTSKDVEVNTIEIPIGEKYREEVAKFLK